jgi:integrase
MAENIGRRGASWYFRVDLPRGTDRRRRQKRVGGFATEREARIALAERVAEVARGVQRVLPDCLFDDLLGEWLAVIKPNRKPTTVAKYEMLVHAYLRPRLGTLTIADLTPHRIQQLYLELRDRGGRNGRSLSGTQVRNVHRVLHNVLAYAVRMGYVPNNAADRVEKPRDDSGERTIYSPEQVALLLEAVRGYRLFALLYLAISAGLRRSELAGLRWTDVDLDAAPPRLHVRNTRTTAGSRVVEGGPKTRSGRRTILLDRGAAEALGAPEDDGIRGALAWILGASRLRLRRRRSRTVQPVADYPNASLAPGQHWPPADHLA